MTVFLTTSFFTASLNLLKSTGIGINLSMSNLSTSVFRLAKLALSAKLEVSTCEIFLISVFVASLLRSILTFIPKCELYGLEKY